MAMRVRLDDGQEIMVQTDDPLAAAAAGRKYQERMKGGLANDIFGGAAKIRQGASLNTSDELAGVGAGVKDTYTRARDGGGSNLDFMIDTGRQPTMSERLQNLAKDFQGGFQRGREREQNLQENFSARRPMAGLGLEIGSSFVPFGLAKGAAQVGGMAAFGGAMSGDTLEERGTNAAIGGATGYGVTKALEGAAPAIGNIFQSGADRLAKRVAAQADEQTKAALSGQQMKEAADRGITMTRGQQTGDEAQIAFEQAARQGARGGWAQNTLKPVFDQQEVQVRDAIQRVAGEGPALGNPNEAGGIVQEALRTAEKAARREVDNAYGAVRDMGGTVRRGSGQGLLQSVDEALAGRDITFDFRSARKLTPQTYQAYDAVRELAQKMTGKAAKTGKGYPYTAIDSMAPPPISLGLVEQTRKLVNTAADNAVAAAKMTGNREDMAAALTIRDTFDNWLDDAIDTQLLTNDMPVLDALKWARGTHRAYADKFRSNAAINNILGKAEDERQALNALFGVAGLGNPKGAAQAIDIISQQSPEGFQALRQAALMRMTDGVQASIRQGNKTDFRQLDKLMGDMMDSQGKAVMQKLFTPAEIAELKTIRTIVQKLIPPRGTVNTSFSGIENARSAQFLFNALRGFGARTGLNVAADAWNAGTAKAALRPPTPPMAPLPGASGRIAAMYGAGNVARKSPGLVGPFTNLMYEDQR